MSIGKTPLIKINEKIWAKLETHNATGSVKDRMIDYICKDAVNSGLIIPGKTTLIEATSGNTGIALASFAARSGCRCIIVMPENMSNERKIMMKSFGAEIIETGFNDFIGAIEIRDTMLADEKFFSPKQFSNILNVKCHFETTAPEILSDCESLGIKFGAFVHGSGTGGTMMGVKKYIDANNLQTKCILTQPEEDNASHGIQGINDGADFLLDKSVMDGFEFVKTSDAVSRMKSFWKESGIMVGISSGANIIASERYSKENDVDGAIITILCDRGERYLSC